MSVMWLRPDQTVLSPAQDHRLLHGGLGELVEGDLDLAGDGVVSAVTARHCEVVTPDIIESAAVKFTVVQHLENIPRSSLNLTAVAAGGVGVAGQDRSEEAAREVSLQGLDCEGDCPPN